ncbi:S8 family peptidase [Maribacter spongiicola]|uniref:S8 family peptidase n=1 Tax=Maribacter spongiicola TaxID=1206753 RepID=UPI003F9B11A4
MKKQKLTTIKFLFSIALGVSVLHSCTSENEIIETSDLNAVTAKSSIKKTDNSSEDYMVILRDESVTDSFLAEIEALGVTVKSSIPEIGIVTISSTEDLNSTLSKSSIVQSIVPDYNVQMIDPELNPQAEALSIGSDEPFFDFLWGMDAIGAPAAWNTNNTGSNVRVAVLDSGIDAEHPDLAPNLNTELSASFVAGEDWNVQPGFYFNHGTHVAGTIAAADNELGVIGVAPNVELVAVKVLSEFTGSGPFSAINAGIVYAADIEADVINMSLGATFNKNGFITLADGSVVKVPGKFISEIRVAQQRAIDYAYRKGVTIVTSAGNGGTNLDGAGSTIKLPASLNNVISVSATAPESWFENPTTDLDLPASYTDYGKSHVTVSAPGGDFDSLSDFWYYDMVLSTISGGWSWSAGTSMAAPHVTGVVALIIGKNGGQMDPHEVTKQLINTSDKIDTNGKSVYHGYGRVNAYRAVTE